jgi:ABC-type thiamine transport system substrate-binding protein
MDILATHFTIMMQLTTEQRVFIVKQYYSSGSPTKVKREFATEYNQDINIKTVNNVVDKWRSTREVISSINQDVMVAVIAHFEKRVNLCIGQLSDHFEHLL